MLVEISNNLVWSARKSNTGRHEKSAPSGHRWQKAIYLRLRQLAQRQLECRQWAQRQQLESLRCELESVGAPTEVSLSYFKDLIQPPSMRPIS
ncbi:MAG: hypothetical protein Athens101428_634 [Candidatus Berkelbacteria bacterium Athens1014_28]|uniref:Uncharacterized protein n=1 Tax=Candidatus Berkelbacteria bacterium Athens1014_28 TaxID=2017145 RepID=A0A554LL39_9BACT|nr:MAG: hypothetical protein Athens101428_634 [Candidatus Berkelbacteria bacterium Athens1014_28]